MGVTRQLQPLVNPVGSYVIFFFGHPSIERKNLSGSSGVLVVVPD